MFLVLNFETLIDNIHLWTAPTVGDFVLSITIAMISYTGIETISNLAEEAREPRRLIPRAMAFVVVAVMVIYCGLPAVALSALPVTETGDAATRRSSPRRTPGTRSSESSRTWTSASSRPPRSTTLASWPPRSC